MFGLLFLVALALVALVVWQSIQQGRRFVRAAAFLREVEGGATVEHANEVAGVLFTARSSHDADAWAARAADAHKERFGGRQADVIRAARAKGFQP